MFSYSILSSLSSLLFFNNAFESSCIRHFYYSINNFFTLILSTSMIYTVMILLILLLLIYQIKIKISIFYNIIFLLFQYLITTLYEVVVNYISYKNNLFFVFISYIFIFIFFHNFIGLIPFSTTINSHLNITGMMSFICWLGILFIGLNIFGTRLFSMFCVSGIPQLLIPLLIFIEILSYFFRFISLSLRLFANIVAGHILLETVYIFLFKFTLGNNNNNIFFLFFILFPCMFFIVLILFETIIAGLQAYIFIVLCLIYLKESLYLH